MCRKAFRFSVHSPHFHPVSKNKIKKILVANRGEIALRVMLSLIHI